MSLQAIKILISVVSGTLALFFNALLAVIILKTHCSFIGSYKYLLFLYTVSAIMYSIAQVTTAANFLMFSDGYMFYDTFRVLPPAVGNWAVDLYSSSFIQNMIILTLSFTYRYLVICNPRGLEVFTRNWMLITVMCLAILGYFVAAMVYVLMPSPLSEEVFGKRFYQATGYNVTDTAYNAGIVTIHGSFNWMLLFALGPLTTLIVVSITIIVVVAVKTARKLKATSTESKTMAEHQRKIFTLLIFQITLPMFFNIFPVQFAVISTFFQLPTDFLVHNIGCVLTIAQIIDPLLVFYFIKPYRQALLRNDPSTGNGQPLNIPIPCAVVMVTFDHNCLAYPDRLSSPLILPQDTGYMGAGCPHYCRSI